MQITVEIPDEIAQFLDQSRGSLSFLKRMGVYLNYNAVELEQDLQSIQEFRSLYLV